MFFWLEVADYADRAFRGFRALLKVTLWLFMVGLMLATFQLWDHKLAASGRSAQTLSTFSNVLGSIKTSFATYAPAIASSGAKTVKACLADELGLALQAVGMNAPAGTGTCGQAASQTAELLPAASIGTVMGGVKAIQPLLPTARAALLPQRIAPLRPVSDGNGPMWHVGGR